MPVAHKITFALLALSLAGCATNPPRRLDPQKPPDWHPPQPSVPAPAPPTPKVSVPPKAVSPKAAVAPKPEPLWIALDSWSKSHGAVPRRLSIIPGPTFAVVTTNGVLVVQSGRRSAFWDGVEVMLGFPPELDHGHLYLHRLDIAKNLEPLMARFDSLEQTNHVIVIDPGHGGGNTGTRSIVDGRFEKEFTLDWAFRLAALLEQHGWCVLLTRTNDVDISLLDRVAFAEAHKADLFISLHFNSGAPNEDPAGLETYCLTPAGMPSNLLREFPDDVTQKFPNNAFDVENLQFALRLHRALLAVNGRIDRGVSRARFLGILRGQRRPAVLVEGGYLSNPAEARRIEDPAFRQKLAEAIATAFGVEPTPPVHDPAPHTPPPAVESHEEDEDL